MRRAWEEGRDRTGWNEVERCQGCKTKVVLARTEEEDIVGRQETADVKRGKGGERIKGGRRRRRERMLKEKAR